MKTVIVECDGGSRGNPGIAGTGSVVYDEQHSVVLGTHYEYIEYATNNMAEYQGLINALSLAADIEAEVVRVRMDSKLVVEQMSGRWKVKDQKLKKYFQKASELASTFQRVDYTWVPRAENKYADELANKAMDMRSSLRSWDASKPQEDKSIDKQNTQEIREEKGVQIPVPHWLGDQGTTLRFILLRHGQTEMSRQKQYCGSSDPELTVYGKKQAQKAAEYIARLGRIDSIICSPRIRTRQTAEYVSAETGAEIHEDAALTELDFGDWEGKSFHEIHHNYAREHQRWLEDPKSCPPRGESLLAVQRRVVDCINKHIRDLRAQNREVTVVLVSHVTPIKAILAHALGASPQIYHSLHLDLAGISIVDFYARGAVSVQRINDRHYYEDED